MESPADRLYGVFRRIRGHELSRVVYKLSGDVDVRALAGVHEVDQAVVLTTTGGDLVVEWATPGYDERLNVTDDVPSSATAGVANAVDVSDRAEWRALLGRRVTGFGVAMAESESDVDQPWAVRIDVSGGTSVVLALGELADRKIEFHATGVVVIFDPEVAQAYEVLGSSESAWGRDLRL